MKTNIVIHVFTTEAQRAQSRIDFRRIGHRLREPPARRGDDDSPEELRAFGRK